MFMKPRITAMADDQRTAVCALGLACCDPGVELGLPGINALPNALDVLVPVALHLVPATFHLARGLLRLGEQLGGEIVALFRASSTLPSLLPCPARPPP